MKQAGEGSKMEADVRFGEELSIICATLDLTTKVTQNFAQKKEI